MDEPKSDAEEVEACRQQMQAMLDRMGDFDTPVDQVFAEMGMPQRVVRLVASDLTEIGKFDLDLPAELESRAHEAWRAFIRRHWVYRHADGRIIALQLAQRLRLRAAGYVDILGVTSYGAS